MRLTSREKAGENFPGLVNKTQTNYKLILRRTNPTAPSRPLPSRSRLLGSGVPTLFDPMVTPEKVHRIVSQRHLRRVPQCQGNSFLRHRA
jgi:hypothetical protein